MTYPVYNFNDPDLDYAQVEATVKLMYSDLVSQSKGCCHSPSIETVLCQCDKLLQAAVIDTANAEIIRYQNDIKTAYLLLYQIVNN